MSSPGFTVSFLTSPASCFTPASAGSPSTVFDRHDLQVLRDAYERARAGIEQAGIADEDARSDLAKLLFGTGRDLIHAGDGLKGADVADLLARSASRAMVELKAMPLFA